MHTALLFGEGEGGLLTASWTGEVEAWDLGRRRKSAGWGFAHFGHQVRVRLSLTLTLTPTASPELVR